MTENKFDKEGSLNILRAVEELDKITYSLRVTGQRDLAELIYILTRKIEDGVKAINQAHNENINNKLKMAEQGTIDMMNALFAGVKLEKNNSKQAVQDALANRDMQKALYTGIHFRKNKNE